jgi:hypothetical protein
VRRLFEFIRFTLSLSSVLKRTRLLIERLVKQRFYASKLGITFRNSKWTNYVKTNSYTTQSSLLPWLYAFLTYAAVVFGIIILLFGTNFIVSMLETLCSNFIWLYTSIFTYYTLVSAFLKTKIYNLFMRVKFQRSSTTILSRVGEELGEVLSENESNLESRVGEQLHLRDISITFGKAQQVAAYLRMLDDNSKIYSLKRLTGAPLSNYFELPGTSENSDLWLLKVWSDAQHSKYESPYVFNGGLDYNQWSLDRMLDDLKLTDAVLELTHLNESYKTRKISSVNSLGTVIFSLQDANNLVKVKRWLFKYNMLHNKSIISSYNITNIKKLLYPFSCTQDMLSKNLWLFNTLNVSRDTNHTPYLKSFYFTHNTIPVIQEADIHATYSYESGYQWFLKRLYFLNSNTSIDIKIAPVVNKSLNKLLNQNYIRNNSVLKVTTLFKELPKRDVGTKLSVNDVFYHTPSAVFYNQNTIVLSHAILANRGNFNLENKNFILNNYSTILNESWVDYEFDLYNFERKRVIGKFRFTYWSFLRHYVKSLSKHSDIKNTRRSKILIRGDFISTEHLKDNYRLRGKSNL